MGAALAKVSRAETTAAMVERVAVMLAEVKISLPEVSDIPELLELRAKSDAMRVFLRQRDAAQASQLDAAEIKLRTERRLGELLKEIPATPNDGSRGGRAGAHAGPDSGPAKKDVLAEMGIAKQRASEWEQLADVDPEKFDTYAEAMRSKSTNVTSARAAVFSSESDEWYTPAKYLDSARLVLGGIDLDPASNPKANELVGARKIFTIEDGDAAFKKSWKGRVWMNPPYGEDEEEGTTVGTWIDRMIAEHAAGHVTAGMLLVNASTDRQWFQPLWAYPICFTDHRIKFYTPSGTPRSPVSGSAFVCLSDDKIAAAFVREFSKYGAVVVRCGGRS